MDGIVLRQLFPIPNNITEANAATLKLNKKKATLFKGKTLTLKVIETKKKVKWESSNRGVATVSSKGKITAKKKETATIPLKQKLKKLGLVKSLLNLRHLEKKRTYQSIIYL